MDIIEFQKSVVEDPRFSEASLEQRMTMKQELLKRIQTESADYQSMPIDAQLDFDKKYLTDLRYQPAGLEEEDSESLAVANILSDIEQVKAGDASSANGWNGATESLRNYLTGKIGYGIVDLFTEGDTVEASFGTERREAEKYRDYVYGVYNPEGITDFKIGKFLGHIAGFAGDAYATGSLYGSVGKAGLLTKPLTGVTTRLMDWSQKITGGSKALGYGIAALGQGAFEASAFVGEEWIANKIIGNLENDQEVQAFVNEIPSKFLQGLAYFAIGEGIGAGFGGMLKGMKSIYTKNGFREMDFDTIWSKSADEQLSIMKKLLGGDDSGTIQRRLRALESAGYSKEYLENLGHKMDIVRSWQNPENLLDDPVKLNQQLMNVLYDMDTEVVGDAIKVKSIMGTKLETPKVFSTDEGLNRFIKEQAEIKENEIFKVSAAMASDKTGSLKLEINELDLKKSTIKPMEAADVMERFHPAGKKVDEKTFESMAEELLGRKVKVIPVEDYYSVPRQIVDDQVFIPRFVNTEGQAEQFADNFFKQMEKLSPNNIKYNIDGIKGVLRNTSKLEYGDLATLRKLAKNANVRLEDMTIDKTSGKVTIEKMGEVIEEFDSIEDATRIFHRRLYSDIELNKTIKKNTGYNLVKEDGAVHLMSESGGKVRSFASVEDIFKDPNYRPGIPFQKRPVYLALDTDPKSIKTFKTGTFEQISNEIRKYERDPSSIIERFASMKGKIGYEPKFHSFVVTMGDSNIKMEFDSLKAAEDWLDKGVKTFKDIEDVAKSKGYMIEPTSRGYMMYSADKSPTFAKSLDDLKVKLGEADDVRSVRDIFDDSLDEADLGKLRNGVANTQNIVDKLKGKAFAKQADVMAKPGGLVGTIREQAAKFLVPMRERIEKLGDIRAVKAFDKMSTANKIYHSEYAQLKVQLHGIFHGKGRNHNAYELENMGKIILGTKSEADWKTFAEASGIELTDDMTSTMQTIRSLMDTLGNRFDIDRATWEKNYISRIKHLTPEKLAERTQDAMQVAKGEGKLGMADEWFRHVRSEDYVAGMFEDNLEVITDMYMKHGLRKQYLGPVLDEMDELLTAKDLDLKTSQLLRESASKLNGNLYNVDRATEKLDRLRRVRDLAEKVRKGEGKYEKLTPEERAVRATDILNRDYNQFANSMVTASLMGFKMKMPIRNMSQVFTTLAPMAGEHLNVAFKRLETKDMQKKLYKEYLDLGIIKPRDIPNPYGTGPQKTVSWLNRYGMAQFYNSDDFTRIVSATAAGERFEDGIAAMKAGRINIDQLRDFMSLDLLHEADQIKFLKFVENNKMETAKVFIQRRWTDLTMFDYDVLNKPEGLTHGIGKIFGQYSTYSLSYAQLMLRGLRQGDKTKALGFAARATIASAAVAAFYNDILNIQGLPGAPPSVMMFTGGPLLSLGASTVVTLSGQGNAIDKGSKITSEALRTMTPLNGIATSLWKSVEELKEAEYRDALSRATGATPADDSAIANFVDMF
jgi:hypothetical protein